MQIDLLKCWNCNFLIKFGMAGWGEKEILVSRGWHFSDQKSWNYFLVKRIEKQKRCFQSSPFQLESFCAILCFTQQTTWVSVHKFLSNTKIPESCNAHFRARDSSETGFLSSAFNFQQCHNLNASVYLLVSWKIIQQYIF
jgi:hypothetical protein